MKVLIIQLKQLGDVLLSSPLAEAIKRYNSSYQVHFLISNRTKDILMLNPFIDKIITLKDGLIGELKTIKEIRKEHYDAILDVQRTGRTKRITLFSKAKVRAAFDDIKDNFYYNTLIKQDTTGYTAFERLDILRAIGITKPKKVMPKLYFSYEDLSDVKHYLKENDIENFFVVSPTARKSTKMWMPEEFNKLTKFLTEEYGLKAIVTYGSPSEKKIAEKVAVNNPKTLVLKKPLTIKQFAALVSLAKFSVGNDSFASHVAVSQNIKTIVICGPTSGWFLENDKTLLVYKGLRCQPCNNPDKCQYNFACYRSLGYKEVADKVLRFLGK